MKEDFPSQSSFMNSIESHRIPVSTVLLTKNVMKTLPAYLASMQEIDDIIVLDGGSTDGTAEFLSQQPNCRVFPQPKEYLDEQGYIIDFSGVRNAGYALARHRWILCVDADESISPALLNDVREIAVHGKPGVYYVKRIFTLGGKPIVSLNVTDHIRLFHLSCVRGCVKPVHERLDVIAGSVVGRIDDVVYVPLHPVAFSRPRSDRYLAIEVRVLGTIRFGRWFRWILLRNIRSIVRRCLVIVLVRLIPKRGPRMPLAIEYEQMRYLWLLMWKTRPWQRSDQRSAISDQHD
ncbi:MAG: glycosyltransferase [Candidatus Peribacteraceae bacterium]|nr:glycosyltransferase [Candidatus Peribacteraceae bacterium]